MSSRRNRFAHRISMPGSAGYDVLRTQYQVPSTQYRSPSACRHATAANRPLQTRNPRPGVRNPRAAFTLIELMIVVVIAVVLLAVALPTVKYSLEEGKLREGARQVNAMFAVAKAHAASTGRYAGVWLELEQIGDPNAPAGNRIYQCSQLYLAEVPAPYCGDVLGARAVFPNGIPALGSANQLQPWVVQFPNSPGAYSLMEVNQSFSIRFDYKGNLYYGITRNINGTDDDNDGSTDETGEYGYYLYGRGGPDGQYGRQGVDDNGNGSVDADMTGPDVGEYGAKGSDDVVYVPPSATSGGYAYQLYRQPQRAGQPLELPQGIVIDVGYSGVGMGPVYSPPSQRVLVMFSPAGNVVSVSLIDQTTGNVVEDTASSKVYFLVGKTELVYFPWNTATIKNSNIADGSNLWVTVNRRNGSIATVENTPDLTLPIATALQQRAFLLAAREFAETGEVKGGQ